MREQGTNLFIRSLLEILIETPHGMELPGYAGADNLIHFLAE
jgi:hypothetical protein